MKLTKYQKAIIGKMEEKIADMIEKYSKDLHYKDVYKKIKDEVEK